MLDNYPTSTSDGSLPILMMVTNSCSPTKSFLTSRKLLAKYWSSSWSFPLGRKLLWPWSKSIFTILSSSCSAIFWQMKMSNHRVVSYKLCWASTMMLTRTNVGFCCKQATRNSFNLVSTNLSASYVSHSRCSQSSRADDRLLWPLTAFFVREQPSKSKQSMTGHSSHLLYIRLSFLFNHPNETCSTNAQMCFAFSLR